MTRGGQQENLPAVPCLTNRPDAVQLFSFSAATWNQHRIHYDEQYTREHEGYDRLLVQGPLLGSWMLEVAENWAEGWGEVTRFAFRTHQPVYVNTELRVSGDVAAGSPQPSVHLWVALANGMRVATGEAEIRPGRLGVIPRPERRPL